MVTPDILKDRRLQLDLHEIDALVTQHVDNLEKDIIAANLPTNPATGEIVPNRFVFNWRGRLYDLAGRTGKGARRKDLALVKDWLNPQIGEVGLDENAGDGFLTLPLAGWTEAPTYAVDTSAVQIDTLHRRNEGEFIIPGLIHPIVGSLSERRVRKRISHPLSYITSFAGIHHMIEEGEQRRLVETMDELLPPEGRVLLVDVAAETSLAHHFETTVKHESLTGHREKWLSEDRLRGELTEGTGLVVNRARIIEDHTMIFNSVDHMVIWSRALHAFPKRHDVLQGLQDDLNNGQPFQPREDGKIHLPWPLLAAELVKR